VSEDREDYALDPDTRLMRAFSRGDDSAFDRIVENFQHKVFGIIHRYIGRSADAEDCAQEVFVRLYGMRGYYRPTARLSTLLYRITANVCLNYIRDEKKRRMVSLESSAGGEGTSIGALVADDSPGVAAPLEKEERARIVRRALDSIPPRQRMALVLHRFEALSYAEVAEAMETNVSSIKSLLHRARTSLAEALRKDIDAGNL